MHVISSQKWSVLGYARLRGLLEIQLRNPIFVMPKSLKLDFTTFKRALQNLVKLIMIMKIMNVMMMMVIMLMIMMT